MTAPVGDSTDQLSRGLLWFRALTDSSARFGRIPSVRSCDMKLGNDTASVIAIVPNSRAKFPRARAGQVGLEEGWELARVVTEALRADAQGEKRAFILIVDSPGQAYGRHEETLGIHHSLAAAVEAYATARKMGHPVIAFLVGKAISGGFLAHGLQADFMLALDTHDVEVHVMSEESVARITRRTPVEISTLARSAPSTARDIRSFASLGAVDVLIRWSNSDEPSVQSVKAIRTVLIEAIASTRQRFCTPPNVSHPIVEEPRHMALLVRQMLETQWF
jgi:malonate decarboxylase beta subunit